MIGVSLDWFYSGWLIIDWCQVFGRSLNSVNSDYTIVDLSDFHINYLLIIVSAERLRISPGWGSRSAVFWLKCRELFQWNLDSRDLLPCYRHFTLHFLLSTFCLSSIVFLVLHYLSFASISHPSPSPKWCLGSGIVSCHNDLMRTLLAKPNWRNVL